MASLFKDSALTRDQLLIMLRELYDDRNSQLGLKHKRSVSFADAILDNRWSRAEKLGFGSGASVYDSALVLGQVAVGRQTWIGPGTILDGTGGGVEIGEFCSISAGVHLYTHDTVLWAISGGSAKQRNAPIRIGDCCHIGAQSIVLPGVVIGKQCVIAANSLVNKNVPDRSVVAGNPARLIGSVEGDGDSVRLRIDLGQQNP